MLSLNEFTVRNDSTGHVDVWGKLSDLIMPLENVMAALSESQQYLADQLEIIEAIPEGMQLYTFPNHGCGPLCWCHPRISFSAGKILIEHKDLLNGEFDC